MAANGKPRVHSAQICVKLPPLLRQRLTREAEELGVSEATVVRMVLLTYLEPTEDEE